jgi:hypothetical protein
MSISEGPAKQTFKETDIYLASNLTGNNFYYVVKENKTLPTP